VAGLGIGVALPEPCAEAGKAESLEEEGLLAAQGARVLDGGAGRIPGPLAECAVCFFVGESPMADGGGVDRMQGCGADTENTMGEGADAAVIVARDREQAGPDAVEGGVARAEVGEAGGVGVVDAVGIEPAF
jgi:hypothetical protein